MYTGIAIRLTDYQRDTIARWAREGRQWGHDREHAIANAVSALPDGHEGEVRTVFDRVWPVAEVDEALNGARGEG